MAGFVSSVKRFAFIVVLLIALAFGFVFLLDKLIAAQTQLTALISQIARTVVAVAIGLIIVRALTRFHDWKTNPGSNDRLMLGHNCFVVRQRG